MSKEITDNPGANRYEIHVDGDLAGFVEYRAQPGRVVFAHTEVGDAYAGQGIGGALVRGALDDVQTKGGRGVVPQCPFVRGWIDKHPEYQEMVISG